MEHGLNIAALSVVSACVVLWGIVSGRVERLDVTAPITFVVLGLVTSNGPLAILHMTLHSSTLRSVAELTLALVLFADASRVNAKVLLADAGLPGRLLGIGLPLTIGAGTAAAAGLFASSGLWVAATIGAILAPTDAALGASIMQDKRVPARIRRTLNVESGLNDGIATPFVNLFLAGALTAEAVHGTGVGSAAADLLGGVAIGATTGVAGAILLGRAARSGWSAEAFRPASVGALAIFAYSAALWAGTNGFVAAFVAGIAFGTLMPDTESLLAFTEEGSTLLSLLVWFGFGAVMVVPGVEAADLSDLALAALALTIVRMVPVAIALSGAKLDRRTVLFIGWFGPRGLASVVFGLIAIDSLAPADSQVVLGATTVTVGLSVILHGVSASPLARRYGKLAAALHPSSEDRQPAPTLQSRRLRPRSSRSD